MESNIKLETYTDGKNTFLAVDNGTNFKELNLSGDEDGREVNIQIDLEEGTMEINGIPISPTLKCVLIQFLNQEK